MQKNSSFLMLSFLFIIGLCGLLPIYGNNNTSEKIKITGVITDAKTGESIPGATVFVKGTDNGVITNIDGEYELMVAGTNDVLLFKFVGYVTQEKRVGEQRTFDVKLEEEVSQLDEILVTALGVERESKTLGYSVQKVDGDVIRESHETNLLNTLSGRVAGVNITNSSGGIGASSNIQIRGQNFVSGYNYNNSPLFVIDGVPISNNNEQSTRAYSGRQDYNNPNFTSGESEVDYGNAAGEIHPNDIKSITILKGPNAAALYGSRASNGVVLITTKSGKGVKGIGVTYNSSFTLESPLKLPSYQYVYGQGRDGKYEYVDGMGSGVNDNILENWGPMMNGQLIAQWDSPLDPTTGERTPTPFVAYPNQLKDFFQTGHTANNSISVQGSGETFNYRFSYSNLTQRGIVPNTDLSRNMVGVNMGYDVVPKVKLNVNINYLNSNSDNRASYGAKNEESIMKIFLYMPRNADVKKMKDYWKDSPANTLQNTPIYNANANKLNNPYFVAHENLNSSKRERFYGNVKISYDILPNLNLMVRTGRDFYIDKRTMRHATSSAQFVNGYYQEDDVSILETNHDFLVTYSIPLNLDFTLSASAGGNLMKQVSERLGAIAPKLSIPNVYNLTNNATAIIAGNTYKEKKINSVYGTVQFGYKNMVFLDLTGRNDWSSALAKKNNSYFYPSASLGVVVTELLNITDSRSNFVKLRGSISAVRRDLEPYQTSTTFQTSQGWGGETVAVHNNDYPNENIKPEKVISYETGFDSRFFQNRIAVDFTFYKTITTDLIIPITLNPSAGYDTKLMNVGKMTNHGIEFMVGLTPIIKNGFVWEVNYNFGLNRNKIIKLAEDKGISRIRQLERWASLELRTENTKGDGSFGSMYGDFLIYKGGELTHKNGLPQEENGDWGFIGNASPKWTAGLSNDFHYKNLSLSCLFSFQKGGAIYSRTYIEGIRNGSLKESLPNRGEDGGGTMIGKGVDVDTDAQNTTEVTVREYWRNYYDNDDIGTFDASYVKLRELKLTYRLPKRLLAKTPITNASLSLVGRNLLLWSNVPNIDPEVSSYDGQFQGVETMSLPSLRSYGVSLNVSF